MTYFILIYSQNVRKIQLLYRSILWRYQTFSTPVNLYFNVWNIYILWKWTWRRFSMKIQGQECVASCWLYEWGTSRSALLILYGSGNLLLQFLRIKPTKRYLLMMLAVAWKFTSLKELDQDRVTYQTSCKNSKWLNLSNWCSFHSGFGLNKLLYVL